MIKLHFRLAGPLDADRRALYEQKQLPYPTIETITATLAHWRTLWEKMNADDRAIKLLEETTDVSLPYDVEVCVIGSGLRAMSYPLIIPVDRSTGPMEDDDFYETIIHELAHRFLTDRENYPQKQKYWDHLHEAYKTESLTTRNHIPVYALCELILPKLVPHPIEMASRHSDYQKAIDLVREKGAQNLVDQFKSFLQ